MKKTTVLIAMSCCISGQLTYGQTKISTAEQLAAIGNDATTLRGNYVLTNDIIVDSYTPIGDIDRPFDGSLDGAGFTVTISGLGEVLYHAPDKTPKTNVKIPPTETVYVGLFGCIGKRGVIQNLKIAGAIAYDDNETGSVFAGGVTGFNYGTVCNCVSTVDIKAGSAVELGGVAIAGGVTGFNRGIVRNCYATGDVEALEARYTYAGGLTGINDEGAIQWSYATGNVMSAEGGDARFAGGITGLCAATGRIEYCVALNETVLSDEAVATDRNTYTGRIAGQNLGRMGGYFCRNDIALTIDNDNMKADRLYELSSLQEQEWWTANRHIRFAFGSNNERPWAWSVEAARPVMHWETDATAPQTVAERRTGGQKKVAATQQPKEIHTVDELKAIGADLFALKRNYILMTDLEVENWTPIGFGMKDMYTGIFDGNGHAITILDFNVDSTRRISQFDGFCVGLFSGIATKGVVKNLRVEGEAVVNSGIHTLFIGGVAGINRGSIACCASAINIKAEGGVYSIKRATGRIFLGAALGGVAFVYQNGVYAGGIVGINDGVLNDCYSTGNLSVSGRGHKYAGGIAAGNGLYGTATISHCYATGSISATSDGAIRMAGGILAMNLTAATVATLGMINVAGAVDHCVALNEAVEVIGTSPLVRSEGVSIKHNNNADCVVALENRTAGIKSLLSELFYFKDMAIFAAETEESESQIGTGKQNVFALKGTAISVADKQSAEWWTKRAGFAIDADDNSPWTWNEKKRLPVLFWE